MDTAVRRIPTAVGDRRNTTPRITDGARSPSIWAWIRSLWSVKYDENAIFWKSPNLAERITAWAFTYRSRDHRRTAISPPRQRHIATIFSTDERGHRAVWESVGHGRYPVPSPTFTVIRRVISCSWTAEWIEPKDDNGPAEASRAEPSRVPTRRQSTRRAWAGNSIESISRRVGWLVLVDFVKLRCIYGELLFVQSIHSTSSIRRPRQRALNDEDRLRRATKWLATGIHSVRQSIFQTTDWLTGGRPMLHHLNYV